MLTFNKYQRQDRVELGTVAQLVGKGGKVKFVPKNLANENKRVAVILERKNGESAMVLCSKAVSEGIRAKTITLANLLGFSVTEQLTNGYYDEEGNLTGDGETINVITMPTGASNLIEVAVDNVKIAEFEPSSELVPEDLIAF